MKIWIKAEVMEVVAIPASFGWPAFLLRPRGVWARVLLLLQVHIVADYDSTLAVRDERRSATGIG